MGKEVKIQNTIPNSWSMILHFSILKDFLLNMRSATGEQTEEG